MKKLVLIVLAMVFVAAGLAQAQSSYAWKSEDASVAIKIRMNSSDTVTGWVNGANIYLGDVTDTAAVITVPTSNTASDVCGKINAVTNASGTRIFNAYVWEALSSDTLTNKVVTNTFTVAKNGDTDIAKWSTAAYKNYTVIPDVPIGGKGVGGYAISRVQGNPGGTGNVTVNVYEDDTLLFQQTVDSPLYVQPQLIVNDTNAITTNAAINTVSLGIDTGGIRIGAGKRGLIKVTRATTATTGGIGAVTTR